MVELGLYARPKSFLSFYYQFSAQWVENGKLVQQINACESILLKSSCMITSKAKYQR